MSDSQHARSGGDDDISQQILEIKYKLDSKPGGLVTAGIVTGIVGVAAIGFAAFLPGRLDTLETVSREAAKDSRETVVGLAEVRQDIGDLSSDVALLIEGVARSLAVGPPDAFQSLQAVLPPSTLRRISEAGHIRNFSYSNFDGSQWIFVNTASFTQLDADVQREIIEVLDRQSVKFRPIDNYRAN